MSEQFRSNMEHEGAYRAKESWPQLWQTRSWSDSKSAPIHLHFHFSERTTVFKCQYGDIFYVSYLQIVLPHLRKMVSNTCVMIIHWMHTHAKPHAYFSHDEFLLQIRSDKNRISALKMPYIHLHIYNPKPFFCEMDQ